MSAAMRSPTGTLDASMYLATALRWMKSKGIRQSPVSDGSEFLGMVSTMELHNAEPHFQELREVLKPEFPHLHSDHTLDIALHRMGSSRTQELPVVSRRNVHKLEGLVTLNDVLRLYGLDEYQQME